MISLDKIGPNEWRVRLEYRFESSRLNRTFTVPAGFATDLGSVPRLLQMLVDDDDGAEGFVVHDWIYRKPALHIGITRKQADRTMRDVMKREGNSWFYRWKAYWGCRIGSGPTWRTYRR